MLVALLVTLAAASGAADPPPCPPIEAPRAFAQLGPSEEPGVLGSHVGVAEGPIAPLPRVAPLCSALQQLGHACPAS